MPIVEIKGLTVQEFRDAPVWIESLKKAIEEAIVSVKQLQLTGDLVTFSCVYDPTLTHINADMIIAVEKLFEYPPGKPARCTADCDELATVIHAAVEKLPGNQNRFVEVFVELFNNATNGYSASDR